MRPLSTLMHEEAGSPVLEIDPNVILSNIITLIVYSNTRPTRMHTCDADMILSWFNAAKDRVNDNDREAILRSYWTARAEVTSAPTDWRDATRIFLAPFADFINIIIREKTYVPNAGEEMEEALLKTGYWSRLFVATPSTGHPRPYLQFNADLTAGMPLLGTDLGEMAFTARRQTRDTDDAMMTAQRALATTLWCLDRVMLNDKLVPDPRTLMEGRDPKETFMGAARAAQRQAIAVASVPLLYMMQLPALWPRMTDALNQHGHDLATRLYPRDRPSLDMRANIRKHVMDTIPVHPLVGLLANIFSNRPMLSTYYGAKPCVLIPTGTDFPSLRINGSGGGRGTHSGLADLVLAAALGESLRLQALIGSSINAQEWVKAIIGDAAPALNVVDVMKYASITSGESYASILEQLTHINRYVELWPQVSKVLGWSGSPSISLSPIEAAGADFVLTDGDYYSDSPLMVLLGLRPSLPISNPRVLGFTRRFETDFNQGPDLRHDAVDVSKGVTRTRIVWSTLTTPSWVAANAGDESLARFYLPEGASMGELGGSLRWAEGVITDPVGERVRNYFKLKSPAGYLATTRPAIPVRDTAIATEILTYYPTDWDAAVVCASDRQLAQKTLLDAYGPTGTVKELRLVYRETGWNLRVPVQMARNGHYLWLDETGNPVRSEMFDGHVVFDNKVDLNVDTGALRTIVDLLKVESTGLLDGLEEQAKPPEMSAT